MSRAYRISMSETSKRHIEVEDGIQVAMELLPVLPAKRMIELLSIELKAKGFDVENAIATRVESDGIVIRIDMENSTIEVTLADQADIEVSHQIDVVVEEEQKAQKEKQLKERLARELDASAEKERELARQQLTQKLKRRLGDIQAEMDQVINATIAAGLKEKAAQLGEIEEVIESGDGSISIRINV